MFGFRDITGVELNPISSTCCTAVCRIAGLAGCPGSHLHVDDARAGSSDPANSSTGPDEHDRHVRCHRRGGVLAVGERAVRPWKAGSLHRRADTTGVFTVSAAGTAPNNVNETGRAFSLASGRRRLSACRPAEAHFPGVTGLSTIIVLARRRSPPTELKQLAT